MTDTWKNNQWQANAGWKCYACRRMNKKNAAFCQLCGGSWEECAQEQPNGWTWEKEPRPSPRKRSVSRRSKPKGSSKGKSDKGKSGKPTEESPSPFGQYTSTTPTSPWPQFDTSPFTNLVVKETGQSSQSSTTTMPTQMTDLVTALKKAYPDGSELPPGVKEALEKCDQAGQRQITRDLHSATTALGKARKALKEAAEAKKSLRNSWTQHLRESITMWETQLDQFRRSLNQLQEAEMKATADIAAAQKAIQSLNKDAEFETVEKEEPTAKQEKEEIDLQKQLHMALTSSAAAIGITLEAPTEIVISDTENPDGNHAAKRPRQPALGEAAQPKAANTM